MKKKHNLLKKSLFTILVLTIYSVGQETPLPGYEMSYRITNDSFSVDKLLAITTGGLFNAPTIFSAGMGPYMTASILLSLVFLFNREKTWASSQELKGRLEVILVLIIAILQSIPLAFRLRGLRNDNLSFFSPFELFIFTVFCLVVGAVFLSWLASMNVISGLGGPFIMISPGIIRSVIGSLSANYSSILIHIDRVVGLIVISFIFAFITVYLYSAEYRFQVQHIGINQHFKGSYLSFRIILAGTMPLMFATTMLYLPAYVMKLLGKYNEVVLHYFDIRYIPGILTYGLIMYVLSVLFSFVTFMPEQINKDLRESNNYLLGVRPGKETHNYILKRVMMFALIGSLFLPTVVISPLLIGYLTNSKTISTMSNYFAMIVVLVAIYDNLRQDVNLQMYRDNYELFGKRRRNYQ